VHHLFEAGTFAAQFLGALGVVPDVGLLELAGDFVKAFLLALEVKDTPSGTRRALADP